MARINARFEQEYIDKLEVLKNQQDSSVTQVLKMAIDEYYPSHISKAASQRDALLASGFIGCAEGGTGLSENYKYDLAESLKAKHDYR